MIPVWTVPGVAGRPRTRARLQLPNGLHLDNKMRTATAYLLLLTLLSSGCVSSMRSYGSVNEALRGSNGPLHLVKTDSTRLVLSSPVIKRDPVGGFSMEPRGRSYRHVAMADVTSASVRKTNGAAVVGIALVAGGLFALAVAAGTYCTYNCDQ